MKIILMVYMAMQFDTTMVATQTEFKTLDACEKARIELIRAFLKPVTMTSTAWGSPVMISNCAETEIEDSKK